jgi:hypothetical protein
MEEKLFEPKNFPQKLDAMGMGKDKQWYKPNTVYQILEVRKYSKKETEEKNIVTTILAKERGTGSENIQPNSFDMYPVDPETINKLKNYSPKGIGRNISSYLPSSGVIFSEGFFEALSVDTKKVEQTEISNFYHPMRTLLYSRKISQLISKTWWSYLVAKDEDYNFKNNIQIWNNFTTGKWNDIIKYSDTESNIKGIDILDGLIAREIFLYGGADSPDNPNPDPNNNVYSDLKGFQDEREQARFLILPSSRGWQGITLSLLLAGQAYYKTEEGYYHQISQPIFSTGEITMLHSVEVDWGKFQGDIKEIIIHHEKPWVGYHIVIPYPPIPSHAEQDNIKKWAWAKEEYSNDDPEIERHFPFYRKNDKDEYLIDVDYFKPPYPYIPLSCT